MRSPHFTVTPQPLTLSRIAPVNVRQLDGGAWLLDFGRAAFGTLEFATSLGRTLVHLGEKLDAEGRVDRNPPGCIRYCCIELDVSEAGERLVIPPDQRNTGPGAVKMPPEIGEVFPFRYVEVEAGPDFDPQCVTQLAAHYPFDDDASHFECSDSGLNAVWNICKYTIKATTFCGVYVDGDRERIPYEGDAYINQLGHYCTDQEYAMPRYSHEYLLQQPTWPTEWQYHSVMMAWEDFCYTGEKASLRKFSGILQRKTLIDLAREDGLISTKEPAPTREFEESLNLWNERYIFDHGLRDLVDWPPGSFASGGVGERDDHDMRPVNTVVNAMHAYACRLIGNMLELLGDTAKAARYHEQSVRVKQRLNELMWHADRGVYVDGEGSDHSSLHSNMFMLAFCLVPEERQASVAAFIKSRGMACSVYGAQYLLESLYNAGEAEAALSLMTAEHDRGWLHMINSGSSMTWEAWDWKYKNNLDWNHAWGAAPANIIPRCLMGVKPEAGFRRVTIQPQPASLRWAKLKHPTPHGPIHLSLVNEPGQAMSLELELPAGVEATVILPDASGTLQTFQGLTGRHHLNPASA
ncbi:alpha-L-rhamnosidase C-terminal domain-containing protein [Cerasicoccus maritimus]|uniref:alpha-L-rhamnosidase-related protein n=1 Tax=Cerasicoccus maritimus TaxID=490089 RepID=UPI0028529A23|nr:alpha-L-rhamnosidase C-terminal domain-containing protein [Cerasicoccus maritimus]